MPWSGDTKRGTIDMTDTTRQGAETLVYIAAGSPDILKAVGGMVHATPGDARDHISELGDVGASLNVYEAVVTVRKDPMPPEIALA